VQTVYELSALNAGIAVVELGTAPRFAVGDAVAITLPPALCLAYAAASAGESRG
jgi:hypothetical protein